MRIGIAGVDGSHAEDFLRHFNIEARYGDLRVTAIWGGTDARSAELLARSPGLTIAGSLEALVSAVDAVIVGDRHGGLHKHHALAAIAAGKPLFIDKPLANSLTDATAIVEAAERARVPLLSGSALRWQPETQALKTRLAAMPGPMRLFAYGTWYPDNDYGGAIYYAIHTVELAQELVGSDWREVGIERGTNPRVYYRAGPHEVTMEFRPLGETGSSAFGVKIETPGTGLDQPIPLGDDYMAPVCDSIAAMLRTGASPMSRDELLTPVALMEEIDRLLA
jgi:predicted dehydrogenase